ncbi:MAG: hypothetical protein OIN88_00660 [Candidatus Methanoperedens sp.]|nr:hypothetical protein [Candidatus Methanoperedens sp.]MCZ7359419.1 hypothetical protein [Candidatus Methanoperedens sp.]HLB70822.1 hypothetical protein [Candidatus Methanoperedens sp.]
MCFLKSPLDKKKLTVKFEFSLDSTELWAAISVLSRKASFHRNLIYMIFDPVLQYIIVSRQAYENPNDR